MSEIIQISAGHKVDDASDYVILQKVGSKFVANGSVAGSGYIAFFSPEPFDTEEEAFSAASFWADANGSPPIYVRSNADQA